MMPHLFDQAAGNAPHAPGLVLAHGAGAGCNSPFMNRLACSVASQGVNVWRFEFPYMQKCREDGRKRPPDRQPVLLEHFRQVVEACRGELGPDRPLAVAGKSMGGRMASLLAASPDGADFQGVVCFGYPFHPPGRPDRWRTDHFSDIRVPVVIFQGTRDPFGRPGELAQRPGLPEQVFVHWLEGGDHDLRPLKKQGLDPDALIEEAAVQAAAFVRRLG